MKNLASAFACAVVTLCSIAPASAARPQTLKAVSVTVTAAVPESGDLESIARENARRKTASTGEESVYLVKVYLEAVPVAGAQPWHLWVDDQEIQEYGSMAKGFFFKLYHADALADLAGKPLKAARGKQPPASLGVDFPAPAAGTPAAAQAQAETPRPTVEQALYQDKESP